MARNRRELAPFYFRVTALLFFALAPLQRGPPFSVRASGAKSGASAQH